MAFSFVSPTFQEGDEHPEAKPVYHFWSSENRADFWKVGET
ncbi:unnamed protein product, partial [marine sediment metagenome]